MRKIYFFKKFLFYFCIIFLPIAIVGTVFCGYSTYHIQQSINDSAENKYTLGTQYISALLDVFPYKGSLFNNSSIYKRVIRKVIQSDSLSYSENAYVKMITAMINNYANTRDSIESVYLYVDNEYGNFIRSGYGLQSIKGQQHTEWIDIFHDEPPTVDCWISSYSSRYYAFEPVRPIVSVFYRMNGINGVIVINMDVKTLADMLDSLTSNRGEMIFVTDREDRFLFGNTAFSAMANPQERIDGLLRERREGSVKNLYNVTLDGEDYVMLEANDSTFGLRFLSLTASDVLYEVPRQLLRFIFIVAGLVALVSLFLSYLITQKNYSQIQHVMTVFDAAEKGAYDCARPLRRQDEYDLILNNVLDVFIRNSYLKLQLQQLALEKQLAEYRALQLQINPHFLFNTLQTISLHTMRRNESENFSDTAQNLADILRYSLELSQPRVSLGEEMAISKKYLAIQQERYPDRFCAIWDYEDDVLESCVLRLILQPMLENSLQHGILPSNHAGIIKVRMEKCEGFLFLCITDNGCGMTKEETQALTDSIHSDFSGNDRHIGLKNVRMRLKLFFGESASMHIYSRKNAGTSISLTLPLHGGQTPITKGISAYGLKKD